MNTPKSYPVVSGLIDQLSEDDSPVSLYDKQGKLENEIRISPFDSISFGTSNHLSDFSSQEVIFSCPGSDTLYFLGKSGITRKISLDYGHNQSPEQFKKSLSNPITFPYFHNFISLGKTVLDLIVIDQKQYMCSFRILLQYSLRFLTGRNFVVKMRQRISAHLFGKLLLYLSV